MANQRRFQSLFTVGALLATLSCGSDPKPQPLGPPSDGIDPANPGGAPIATAIETAKEPEAPPLPPVEFAAGKAADAPAKAPTIAIKAPTANQVIPADKAGDFEVKLDLKNWDVPAGGNHVHVILDNRPYKRIDDAKAPIKLKDLDPSYTLAEGQHVLVAFPSRHTHESVKPVGKVAPLAVVTFWVGKKGDVAWKPTDPTFVFSRPKGKNDGPAPAEGILVDWYLANAELGDGKFSIEATLSGPGVNGENKVTIKEWTPWRIRNVRDGAYKLRMVLLGKDGKPVPGAWNDTTREFQIDQKAPAPMDHPMPAATTAPTATPATTGAAPKASAAPTAAPAPTATPKK